MVNGKKESSTFVLLYNIVCEKDRSSIKKVNDWFFYSDSVSVTLFSGGGNASLILSCKDKKPKAVIYKNNGIFFNREKWLISDNKKPYTAEFIDLNSSSLDLGHKSNKYFLSNIVNFDEIKLTVGAYYENEDDTFKFSTLGLKNSIEMFRGGCRNYNWKKYWDKRVD